MITIYSRNEESCTILATLERSQERSFIQNICTIFLSSVVAKHLEINRRISTFTFFGSWQILTYTNYLFDPLKGYALRCELQPTVVTGQKRLQFLEILHRPHKIFVSKMRVQLDNNWWDHSIAHRKFMRYYLALSRKTLNENCWRDLQLTWRNPTR